MNEGPTVASGCGPIVPTAASSIDARPDHAIARFDPACPRFIVQFQAHEEEEFRDAVNGSRWRSAVDEFAQELRQILKYRQELPENTPGIEEARTLLFRILEENNLTLYD